MKKHAIEKRNFLSALLKRNLIVLGSWVIAAGEKIPHLVRSLCVCLIKHPPSSPLSFALMIVGGAMDSRKGLKFFNFLLVFRISLD
jgi:Ca2+/Na+ antiporter